MSTQTCSKCGWSMYGEPGSELIQYSCDKKEACRECQYYERGVRSECWSPLCTDGYRRCSLCNGSGKRDGYRTCTATTHRPPQQPPQYIPPLPGPPPPYSETP